MPANRRYKDAQEYYPALKAHLAVQGAALPGYVEQEFEDYLKCGRLEHGFLRVRCDTCHAEHLVAFSCKRRGFCPSCGARRMAESAALLVDEVFPEQPIRQWVLSVPYPLRFLFASRPEVARRKFRIRRSSPEDHGYRGPRCASLMRRSGAYVCRAAVSRVSRIPCRQVPEALYHIGHGAKKRSFRGEQTLELRSHAPPQKVPREICPHAGLVAPSKRGRNLPRMKVDHSRLRQLPLTTESALN